MWFPSWLEAALSSNGPCQWPSNARCPCSVEQIRANWWATSHQCFHFTRSVGGIAHKDWHLLWMMFNTQKHQTFSSRPSQESLALIFVAIRTLQIIHLHYGCCFPAPSYWNDSLQHWILPSLSPWLGFCCCHSGLCKRWVGRKVLELWVNSLSLPEEGNKLPVR